MSEIEDGDYHQYIWGDYTMSGDDHFIKPDNDELSEATMTTFTDPDTQDFFDAWLASLHDPEQFRELRTAAYGAGWDAAMRAVREARLHEDRIRDEERRQEEQWNRFQPQYP